MPSVGRWWSVRAGGSGIDIPHADGYRADVVTVLHRLAGSYRCDERCVVDRNDRNRHLLGVGPVEAAIFGSTAILYLQIEADAVAIIKKRLKIPASLYTILQVLSLTVFEKIPLSQPLRDTERNDANSESDNQLNLFE